MRPGAFGDFLSGIFVTNREAILQNITLVDRVFFEHRLWQINPTSRSILSDVTQYVGQLQRLAKVSPESIPALLESMDVANPFASNYLRGAVEGIAGNTLA